MDNVVVLTSSSTRHSCKVCGKGFPCGRSLGGHMRSHALAEVAAAAAADEETTDSDEDDERRWIQSGGARASIVGAGGAGYGLRENPKKTRRLSRSPGGNDVDHDEYGQQLSPCRPVFDHVRRHGPADGGYSDGEDVRLEIEEPEAEDMLIRSEAAVVMTAPAPRRRRRSMRVPAPPPPRESFDKEPEDVALCLIMLSRDTAGLWGKEERLPVKGSAKKARNGFYHDDADSDDNSALLQYADAENARRVKKRKTTSSAYAGSEKRGRYECPGCGRAFQSYQALGGHRASHKRINSNCCTTKVLLDQPEPSVETTASFSTPSTPDADDAYGAVAAVRAKKAIKFECPICFKVFGSGQALGGHKRSHSIAGELNERNHADGEAVVVDTEQSLIAAGFLDLNLPAPGAED
uniref:Uncharacterized protein n=1 Tax=Avena sativa TaxID=4498 RepID=A0ACD5X3M6_AVESA